MTLPARFAIVAPSSGDGCLHVFTATPRRELGDEWLAPSARTYHIAFQGSLRQIRPPAPTQATAFTPVSLVMVRACGQYRGCGQYHGEIVHNTSWRQVATMEEDLPLLEFSEHPPWPIISSILDRKWI